MVYVHDLFVVPFPDPQALELVQEIVVPRSSPPKFQSATNSIDNSCCYSGYETLNTLWDRFFPTRDAAVQTEIVVPRSSSPKLQSVNNNMANFSQTDSLDGLNNN